MNRLAQAAHKSFSPNRKPNTLGVFLRPVAIIVNCLVLLLVFSVAPAWSGMASPVRGAAPAVIPSFSVKDFGAAGDGVTDDSGAIQAAINALPENATLYVPLGTYKLRYNNNSPYSALTLKSNMTLSMETGATFQLASNSSENYRVLELVNVSNVSIQGGTIVGDRDSHGGSTGEGGMGIAAYSASNIILRDITVKKCWGDGIYIGGASGGWESSNVQVLNCTLETNRRNGCSITALEGGTVDSCRFLNSGGTAPGCGLDIEPNTGRKAENLIVRANECSGNVEGIQVTGMSGTVTNISFESNHCAASITSDGNGGDGIRARDISNCRFVNNICEQNSDIGVYAYSQAAGCEISGNTTRYNGGEGIRLNNFCDGTVSNNTCSSNSLQGIYLNGNCQRNTVSSNVCEANSYGIAVYASSSDNHVCLNQCNMNRYHGISLDTDCNRNLVQDNSCTANGQATTNKYSNIVVFTNSDFNSIFRNACRAGSGTIQSRYGVNIYSTDCDSNSVIGNDLLGAGYTANLNDSGTGTVIAGNLGYDTSQAPAPTITGITPSEGLNTGSISITSLTGSGFQPGTSVSLKKTGQVDKSGANVAVVSSGQITCTFDLVGACAGDWDVCVANPDGQSVTKPGIFRINQLYLTITSITPSWGSNRGSVNITNLVGSGFQPGARVVLKKAGQRDITGISVVVRSSTQITCTLSLKKAAKGSWDVWVYNPTGESAVLTKGFQIR